MNLFEIIGRIKKGGKFEKGIDLKDYQPFLIPRFLAMNIANVFGANHLNKYSFLGLKKEHHLRLMRSLPWDASYSKYIKSDRDKDKNLKELVGIFKQAWKATSAKEEEIIKILQLKIISDDEVEATMLRLGTETRKFNKLLKYYRSKK